MNKKLEKQLEKHFENATKLQVIEFVKKQSQRLYKLAKMKESAVNREFNNNLGASKALGTTLYAKAEVATEQYNNCEEDLIYVINNILVNKI